jgi:hypothetical protein
VLRYDPMSLNMGLSSVKGGLGIVKVSRKKDEVAWGNFQRPQSAAFRMNAESPCMISMPYSLSNAQH